MIDSCAYARNCGARRVEGLPPFGEMPRLCSDLRNNSAPPSFWNSSTSPGSCKWATSRVSGSCVSPSSELDTVAMLGLIVLVTQHSVNSGILIRPQARALLLSLAFSARVLHWSCGGLQREHVQSRPLDSRVIEEASIDAYSLRPEPQDCLIFVSFHVTLHACSLWCAPLQVWIHACC